MFNFPCVIVAGGKSSRMGEDKALLPFDKENTLLEYQIKRLQPLFQSLHVSLKDEKINLDVPIIFDNDKEIYSPMVAFLQILSSFPSEYIFVLSVDTPFVNEEVVQKLFVNKGGFQAIVPKTKEGMHPLCGLYHSSLAKEAKKLIEEDRHAIKNLLQKAKTNHIFFDKEKLFMNLNYKNEYEKAKTMIIQ